MNKPFLPMKLQLFAESEASDNAETVEQQEEVTAETTEESSIDSDKVIEKLQKRIGKETSEKKETQEQLEQALKRIEELETSSKKGVKEQSDEEKAIELQKAKDTEIEKLRNELKLRDITIQVDEVLKESGFALNKEELALVVDTDEEQSYSKVKTMISLINRIKEQEAISYNTGKTPKKVSNTNQTVTAEQFNAMTYAEKAELAKNNPDEFNKIIGGH